MASTSFLARSRGDKDVSCQANVVSDKVGLPQWASPYSLNIESVSAMALAVARPPRQTEARQREASAEKGDMTNPDAAHELHIAYTDRLSAKDIDGML